MGKPVLKTLFISYNEALNPLILSQGIPYLRGLASKGVTCHLLTFEQTQEEPSAYLRRCRVLDTELRSFGIHWHRLRYHKRPTLPATLFDILCGIMMSLRLILAEKIDIIHGRATVPALMAYIAARLSNKKFLFDERGIMAEEYVDGGLWPRGGFLHTVTSAIEKRLLRSCDALVVLTQTFKSILLETDYVGWNKYEIKPPIQVIPCCVDMVKFSPNGDRTGYRTRWGVTGRFVFMYSGSLGTWYMLGEMLDFFKAALEIIPNAHFLMLVRTDKSKLDKLCAEKGIPPGRVTTDTIDFAEMPHAISAADVALFFIKPVFSKKSSCPTKLAEFLACGIPVVINAGVGDSDRIVLEGASGVIVQSFASEEYFRASKEIAALCRDKTSIAARCVSTAKRHFDLNLGVQLYWEVYKGLTPH